MEGGFADILQGNLSAIKDVRLVEREKLHAVLAEQKLSLSGLADPATAIKVGKLLGAQRLVVGSFVEMGDDLRLDVRLADSQTAAVLAAETATGKSADFATLLEGLALRLAADLAVQPEPDAADRVKAATPIRSIEAAIHLADGDKAFAQGQYSEAAKAYERVLLAEPKNLVAGMRRTRAWFELKDYRRTIEAGEQTLAAGVSPKDLGSNVTFQVNHAYFFITLARAYYGAGEIDKEMALCRRIISECPSRSLVTYALQNIAYRAMTNPDRVGEGETVLKDAVEAARKKNDPGEYSHALHVLFLYYENAVRWYRPERTRNIKPESARQDLDEKAARWQKSADDILDVALKAAEAHHDSPGATGPAPPWTGPERPRTRKPDTRRFSAFLRGMSWVDYVPRLVHPQLAPTCVALERWDDAIKSYRYLAGHPHESDEVEVPDPWDIQYRATDSGMDQETASLYEIGWICQHHLNRPEEARREYQQIVDRFGLLHAKGPAIAYCLHELGKEPVLPPKAALVWGGRDTTQKTWDAVLGPMGFKTHMVAQYTVSEAHLRPIPSWFLPGPG